MIYERPCSITRFVHDLKTLSNVDNGQQMAQQKDAHGQQPPEIVSVVLSETNSTNNLSTGFRSESHQFPMTHA